MIGSISSACLGVAFVAALLKILLVAARLQHLDRELLVEVSDRAGAVGNGAGGVLREAADLVDRAEDDETDKAEESDRHDLVGEANGEAAH
ncbi:NADH:ubiquinone oxidoreductase subunit H [Bradyrhizobium japonicum]|nr:NADH:ubiquinone oxidoreductase subunit H [Bradyrhizobium japonicum]MCP1856764.1 NADH:ubiquinone oxidoreductase subunit H [Bradyrhizobium japonicum]MCP1887579.1 NADH:ubiquinone oxidoreductase subunit H [Bradyrhizobium japonicum]MCP1959724.1 NADH:ubiquinone oxidoreductase subunit H [Bradyrhizobium japonicum]MCW2320550.1 NADH:ubiquinone oxidoreductase subunit H [Bradyrhizobium japonicum]